EIIQECRDAGGLGEDPDADIEQPDRGDELPRLAHFLLGLLQVGGEGRPCGPRRRRPARGCRRQLLRRGGLFWRCPGLLGRRDGTNRGTHVAALASDRNGAAARVADGHGAISGPAIRSSVTVVQQEDPPAGAGGPWTGCPNPCRPSTPARCTD